MKKLSLFIIVVSWTVCLYAAVPNEVVSSFNAGNSLYQEGKYEEAIEKYTRCITQGYVSGALYYDIGNCYFKLGRLGKTILYYRRAQKMIPHDPELMANLSYVMSMLEDKISPPRCSWLAKKINILPEMFSLGKWLGFTLLVWLLIIGLALIAIFVPRLRRIYWRIFFILIISLFAGLTSIGVLYSRQVSPAAIILTQEVPVYYGPSEGDVEAFLLHEGTEVKLRKEQAGWYQIQLPDGKSGWLPGDVIEKV